MKACFFLQRRFAYFGHAMATILKDKYKINEFCGYVSLRSGFNFLQSQNEIKYTKLLLEEDVYADYKNEKLDKDYLNFLEKEYGIPNLWPFLDMDRILRYNLLVRDYPYDQTHYSHEELLRILQVTAKRIISFLKEEKPDFIFFSVVSNLSSMLLYFVAQKMGIRTLILFYPRIGNKVMISNDFDKFNALEQTFQKLSDNKQLNDKELKAVDNAIAYLKTFQKSPFYYLESSAAVSEFVPKSVHLNHFIRTMKWLLRSHWEYIKNTNKNDYSLIKPWEEFWDKIKKMARKMIGYEDLYEKPVPKEEYAFFPLHTEPEAVPMFLAPWYMDQIWLVKQIARSLPVQYKLYVKDHPRMIGKRKRLYYKELKKIPNVRIISPLVSSLSLIENSKLILTIAGTAGFEALQLKKPVIVFADLFYNKLSGVEKCESIPQLAGIIKEHLASYKYEEKELIDFIANIYLESVDVDIIKLWSIEGGVGVLHKDKAKIVPLVDLIAKALKIDKI